MNFTLALCLNMFTLLGTEAPMKVGNSWNLKPNQPVDSKKEIGEEVELAFRFLSLSESGYKQVSQLLSKDAEWQRRPRLTQLTENQFQQLLKEAQQNPRTNVMQAPKVTVEVGQDAKIEVRNQQLFVTGVSQEKSPDGDVYFVPKMESFKLGWEIGVRASVMKKTKFTKEQTITIHGNIRYSYLVRDVTPIYPIVTEVTQTHANTKKKSDPASFTQYIQNPTMESVQIQTAQTIKTGKTLLLGGRKIEREVIKTQPMPILGHIPYLGRLFQNKVPTIETQYLLIAITPKLVKTVAENK